MGKPNRSQKTQPSETIVDSLISSRRTAALQGQSIFTLTRSALKYPHSEIGIATSSFRARFGAKAKRART